MSYRRWAWAALAFAAACSNSEDSPTAPTLGRPGIDPAPLASGPGTGQPDRDRHQRFARRFARALRDPAFRSTVYQAVSTSSDREGKVHLQEFLTSNGGQERRALARLASEPEQAVAADLDQGGAVEFYLPVAAHRRLWRGDERVLVATAEVDTDTPVAFDLLGRRHVLDPNTPPSTPVLMVARAERRYGVGPAAIGCVLDCGGGTGGGGSGTTPAASQGLYLAQTSFAQTFEGWFKGDPEFEVHIMGPATPGSTKMTSYQCIGAQVGGPYYWDQNGKTWTGNVLLFSPTQLDQYRATHGNEGFRVFLIEDDDTACEIKVDSTRVTRMLDAVSLVYGTFTGAKDSTLSFTLRAIKRASTIAKFLKASSSFFLTNDDPVGNAVEDPIVGSTYFTGANWVVKGENSATNGAIKLVMR
ncbi:MAG: hypothetical protein ACKVZ0_22520 [Gemmatimonadales bacterium]